MLWEGGTGIWAWRHPKAAAEKKEGGGFLRWGRQEHSALCLNTQNYLHINPSWVSTPCPNKVTHPSASKILLGEWKKSPHSGHLKCGSEEIMQGVSKCVTWPAGSRWFQPLIFTILSSAQKNLGLNYFYFLKKWHSAGFYTPTHALIQCISHVPLPKQNKNIF